MGSFLVFIFKIVESLIQAGLRQSGRPPTPPRSLTPREQVLELERIRQRRNYKPGWLYHRCKELGLEDTLQEMRDEQRVT
jgi:hypothetical protein